MMTFHFFPLPVPIAPQVPFLTILRCSTCEPAEINIPLAAVTESSSSGSHITSPLSHLNAIKLRHGKYDIFYWILVPYSSWTHKLSKSYLQNTFLFFTCQFQWRLENLHARTWVLSYLLGNLCWKSCSAIFKDISTQLIQEAQIQINFIDWQKLSACFTLCMHARKYLSQFGE